MSTHHPKLRLKPHSPQIGQRCPVSGKIFEAGDDVRLCQQSDAAFSAKHWTEAIAMWDGVCIYCNLPLEDSVSDSTGVGPKKQGGGYTYEEPRRRDVSIPMWALVTFGGGALAVIGLLIGLLFSGGPVGVGGSEGDKPDVEVAGGNVNDDNLSNPEEPSKPTSTHTPTQTPSRKTPTPTSTKTATKAPPSPTKTRRPTATRTPRPTATPKPQQASFASTCEKTAKGEFANLWRTYQQQLGCPRHSEPVYGQYAEMPFERGHLFWIGNIDIFGDTRQIIAVFGGQNEGDTGTWSVHPDTWNGQGICGVPAPPAGFYLPDRGIAKVWCEIDGLNRLGYATAPQEFAPNRGVDAMQNFEKGVVFRDSDGHSRGLVYMLLWDSMTYRRVRY